VNHTEHMLKTPSQRTGFFATLASLLGTRGSSAPSSTARLSRARTSAAVLAITTFALLAFAPGALASPSHPYIPSLSQSGYFEGCGAAVDSHGYVYAVDYGTIHIYNPSGALVTSFQDPDENACQIAVDNSGDIYVQEYGDHTYKMNPSSPLPVTGSTTYSLDPSIGGGTGVLDSGAGNSVAVDPSTGDVYVAHEDHISSYQPNGTLISATIGSGVAGANFTGVAVNAASGDVYANNGGTIDVFDPAVSLTTPHFTFDGSDSPTGAMGDGGFGEGITVDQSNGHVYAYDGTHNVVNEFDSSGVFVSQLSHAFADGQPSAVAVDNSGGSNEGDVYVVSGSGVDAFGPLTYSTLATAATNAATAINHTVATLNGHVDPGSETVTDCHFDWGTTTAYSGGSVPCEQGNNIASPTDVTAALANLHPGTTYHFRLDITGSISGQVTGSDQSFTATAFSGGTDAATAVNHTVATLNGHFDPQGDSNVDVTACSFDWGTDTSYSGGSVPCDQSTSPPISTASSVTASLPGLHPGTTYHFRLHLSLANGDQFTGSDKSFTTTAFPVSTEAATTLHHTDVILNGHFDPQGDPNLDVTACSFDWGTDTSYSGGSVPCDQSTSPPISTATSVSALLNDLSPGLTYHFRLHLTTAGAGAIFGPDLTVTPPPFPTLAPTELTSFGPDGTSATSFGSSGPAQLAFDNSARHLYAVNPSSPGIYGFDASAPPAFPPLGGFDPLSTVAPGLGGIAVDNSSTGSQGQLYLASSSTKKLYGFNSSGAPLGGSFPIDLTANPGALASSQFGCGAAVDSSGRVWVTDEGNSSVFLRYSSSGAAQSSISTFAPCSIAFAQNGDLYVGNNSDVLRYTASSNWQSFSAIIDNHPPTGLAVDPVTGDLFDAHGGQVSVYGANNAHLYDFGDGVTGSELSGIAVDPANHYIFLSDKADHKIHVFPPGVPQTPPTLTPGAPTAITGASATLHAKVDPEGFQVTDCHFEAVPDSQFQASGFTDATASEKYGCTPDANGVGAGSGDVAVSAGLSGLDGGTTYDFRIVASNAQSGGTASGADQTLTTAGPQVQGTAVSAVRDSQATLSGQVNPEGAATTYHFEYGTDTTYGHSAPASPVAIGSANAGLSVSEQISGLAPLTTYHFRLVAQSPAGTDRGPDVTFTTKAAPSLFGPCPNEQFRTGPSASLPDCRAYEQVSPADKQGAAVAIELGLVQASPAGDRISFADDAGLPTTGGSSQPPIYGASRGASSWSTNGLVPPTNSLSQARLDGWSPDLSTSLSDALLGNDEYAFYLGDTAAGTWSKAFEGSGTFDVYSPSVEGFAADTQHVVFDADSELVAGATGSNNLYDLDHGTLTLAGRVPVAPATSCDDASGPACVPAPGGSSGVGLEQSISSDGSKVFFTASGQLYMRVDATRTAQISAPQGPADPNGHEPAAFAGDTPSGSEVFFTSCEKLTASSTAVSDPAHPHSCAGGSQGSDLYAYDTGTGSLTDLSVDSNGDPHGADVQGVLGNSADGSDVYFVAKGALATGASAGQLNLYLRHGATTTFIAGLGSGEEADWSRDAIGTDAKTSRVAADGTLLFSSTQKLTAYAPTGQGVCQRGCAQLYRYRPGDSGPLCVSCDPTGAPPVGPVALAGAANNNGTVGSFGAAPNNHEEVLTRNISADGNRVFFDSDNELVAADTNGDDGCPSQPPLRGQSGTGPQLCTDVYEWEASGSGSCTQASSAYSPQDGGCLYLLSGGTSDQPSYLADVSASGDDAFIITYDSLLPGDQDQGADIYDARVDGGIASQHTSSPPPCSSADSCHGASTSAPARQGAGSGSLQGPGNPPPKHKKSKKKKNHKRPHKRAHRRAGSHRGGHK